MGILMISLGLICLTTLEVLAQTVEVSGRVTDSNGEGIPGASVLIQGSSAGTVTDLDGNYRLNAPDEDAVLVFSFIGYERLEVPLNGRTNLSLALKEDIQALDEVVVVGFGEQRKRDLTGAIGQVDAKRINELPVAGFDQAIQGKVAGVRVQNSNAAPGGGFDIQVRGVGSITGNNFPLVVIDGMPLTEENYQEENNPFNLINPNDIASVEILKDASSSAIYGARAANGVILITTKRGKGKPTFNLNVSSGFVQDFGITEVADRAQWEQWWFDTKQYAAWKLSPGHYNPESNETWSWIEDITSPEGFPQHLARLQSINRQNDGLGDPLLNNGARGFNYWGYIDDPNDPFYSGANNIEVIDRWNAGTTPFHQPEYFNTDWTNILQREGNFPGRQQNYYLSASGGSENSSFLVSGSYFNETGVIQKTQFERFTANLNYDMEISEWLKVGTKMSPSLQDLDNIGGSRISNRWHQGALYAASMITPPFLAPYQDPLTGDYTSSNTGLNADYSRNSPFRSQYLGWGTTDFFNNPLNRLEEDDNRKTFSLLANFWAEAKLSKDLKLRTLIAGDYRVGTNITFTPSTAGSRFSGPGPINFENGVRGSHRKSESKKYYWQNTLTYTKTFAEKHNVNAIVGYTQEYTTSNFATLEKRNYTSDEIRLAAGGSVVNDPSDVTDGLNQDGFIGILGRVMYNYNNKYYLTLGVRRDGSSRFGSDNRWGNFPSVAVAYTVSEEGFMDNIPFIDNLKVRASYGQTGNSSIPRGRQQRIITFTSFLTGGGVQTGLRDQGLYDPTLGWEKTVEYNLGLDLAVFEGRLYFTGDVYQRTTTDMLLEVDVPAYTGFGSILRNFGEMENKGIELAVGGTPIYGPLKWSVDFNISQNRQKITKLFPGDENRGINGRRVAGLNPTRGFVGGPMSVFWGRIYDGVWRTWEEIENNPSNWNYRNNNRFDMAQRNSAPGEARLRDVNGDGLIDGNDRTVIGNPWPDFYWGFSNTLEFKGFDLYIQMDGSIGAEVYNWSVMEYYSQAHRGFNLPTFWLNDYWTPNNPDAEYPIVSGRNGNTRNNVDESSFVLEDGDYTAIRTVRLGYTFPRSIVDNLFLSGIRVYANVQNALYFTKYTGFNPEGSNQGNPGESDRATTYGVDGGNYPLSRTITFGVDLRF